MGLEHKYFEFDPSVEDENFPEFVCSMSPLMREMVKLANGKDKIYEMAKGVVWQIDREEPEVAASLKSVVIATDDYPARRVDIRSGPAGEGGKIIFKCFVRWSDEYNSWMVLVEGPDENHWEEFLSIVSPGDN